MPERSTLRDDDRGQMHGQRVDDASMHSDHIAFALNANDDEVGPACMNVPVPPTIANDDEFREAYVCGYRHALADVRKWRAERGEDTA